MTETVSASLEDYLKVIFVQESSKGSARPKDIADDLKITRPSVTGALRTLVQKGLVNHESYGRVTLTAEGFRIATNIIYKHKVLLDFFRNYLGVPEKTAEKNACSLEHRIDDQVMTNLVRFIEFIDSCPRTGSDWKEAFHLFKENKKSCEDCISCINECRTRYKEEQAG